MTASQTRVAIRIDREDMRSFRDGREWEIDISEAESGLLHHIPGLRVGRNVARGAIDALDVALVRLGRGGLNDVVVPVFDVGIQTPPSLRPYQHSGVERLVASLRLFGGALLADDMGLGKSRQAIVTASNLVGRVLVVCPASVRETWREQLKACGIVGAILGPPSEKKYKVEWAGASTAQWVVTSYELAPKALDAMEGLPTTLIVDEAHIIKGRTNVQTKTIRRISQLCRYRLAITGTPQWDRPRDWFSLLDIILPGSFGNSWHFDHSYCDAKINEWGGLENKGASRTEELQRRLKYYMVRRTKEEVAKDLPPLSRQIVWLDPTPEARALYDRSVMFRGVGQLAKALAATYEGKLQAAIDLAVAARLFLLVTYRREDAILLHRGTVKAGVPAAVVHGGIPASQRSAIIKQCLETKLALISTMDVLSTGVDGLQHLTQTGIFHAIDWQPSKMAQMEARLHRIGSVNAVSWTYLAMRDTADDPVVRTVVDKLTQQVAVLGGESGMRDTFEGYENGAGQDETAMLAALYAGFTGDVEEDAYDSAAE